MLAYTLLQANQPEESLQMIDKYLQCSPANAEDKEILWIKGRAEIRVKKNKQSKASD
jgi:outer membrane protein assembly factor BamD (BamD/ComL family)